MTALSGLPGIKTNIVDAEFFRSVSEGIRGLKKVRARTSANDHGAINLWVDDAGFYQGERMAFGMSKSKVKVSTSKELEAWLKKELPKIGW